MTLAERRPSHPRAGDPQSRDPGRRLDHLLDAGSAVPIVDSGDANVRLVRGRVEGTPVVAYCTDATTMGGAIGAREADLVVTAIETAVAEGCPVVGIWHSAGAKLAEGVSGLEGIGRMFAAMTAASGRVPQLSLVLGPAAGGAAYGPALTDLIVMAPSGRVFVTGPEVVRSATGEDVDMEELGGGDAHGRRSGVVHTVADTEDDAYRRVRRLTLLLARPGAFARPSSDDDPDLSEYLPTSARRAYDVRPMVHALLDDGSFEELQARWAPNVVIGLGRMCERTVGVIANNPLRKGGCLDSRSAEKASRFVRLCDSLGVPLVVVVDVPGYLPGVGEEWDGVVRRGAKLLYAFAEAVVPRVTLVTRKSYGGAYIAMNSRSLGASAVLVWPGAEIAVMAAEAAVGVLHRRTLAAAPEPERAELRSHLADEHRRDAGGIEQALSLGAVDEVVEPARTRAAIVEHLRSAPTARGAHGNIPL